MFSSTETAENLDQFWRTQAQRLDWIVPFSQVKNTSFHHPVSIRWFEDGMLNVSANCLDRHLATSGDQPALIWEPDDPTEPSQTLSYRDLYNETVRFADLLVRQGVQKGDRVTIYMPMIPAAACAMLACARIGAIHSVVFGGFSPESLKDRILDCDSRIVITADYGRRGGRTIPLKQNVDLALTGCPDVTRVIVVRHTGDVVPMQPGRDVWYHDLVSDTVPDCPPVPMGAEDPLFILYTSGSTGKPKGVLHSTGGYLLYAAWTHQLVFDYRPGDIYWCTADLGWITGHSYLLYGPLANRATTVMFEGVPNYPDVSRFWQIIDKHRVSIFYTAPTAIRALMREGDDAVRRTSRQSLRVLGTVGEPINPEAWRWYHDVVGDGRCPVADTWWQTETGGMLIAPIAGTTPTKPGSATLPLPGVMPVIVDAHGAVLDGACEGNLCLKDSWPGQARTVFRDHDRFEQTYFSTFPGLYFTGDGCRRDDDGYYWITGRVDDVINVSGHRLGTAEIESALVAHHGVAEAAVVGYPHDLKGQGIYAYVTLTASTPPTEALRAELIQWVRRQIGPIATPDLIQWAPALPKTRSGKIMRRILRKIAADECDQLGDISTLADPAVVTELTDNRMNRA